MRLVSFSDIHGDYSVFKRSRETLKTADIVILSGDITDFGKKNHIYECINELKLYLGGKIIGVAGNCDYPICTEALKDLNMDLHGRVIEVDGFYFAGLGGSLITPFSTPNEFSEKEYRVILRQMETQIKKDKPLIFISHQPPINCKCDIITTGAHVGSVEVRSFIEKHNPIVCFTGHIHEAASRDEIGNTIILNPGQAPMGKIGVLDYDHGKYEINLKNLS